MTREEYFEIKDDCVKNGRVKAITAEDTKESLRNSLMSTMKNIFC